MPHADGKLRVNLPPDPNPRPLKFKPPAGSWDTHFHLFGPPQRFPYVEDRRYTPPAAPLEHYIALMNLLGIERGVLVHPMVHGLENRVTLDALQRTDGRLRGMIRANPALEDIDMRRLHEAGVRGVRFNLVEETGGSFDRAAFDVVAARCAKLGWPVCLHIPAEKIEPIAELLRRAPVNIIFDHFGRIDARQGVNQPMFRALVDLMGEPNMWCKISGIDRLMQRGARYEDAPPFAKALLDRAPDRIIWGTDWPHSSVYEHGKMANDGDLINALLDLVPDEAQRNRVLVDNPGRLFDFG